MTAINVTRLLEQASEGNDQAREDLAQALYGELRRLAGGLMRRERAHHTLQPTALVNEAWLRLAGAECEWENRAHFFGAAAQAMRRILVDAARTRLAEKRGGDAVRVTFEDFQMGVEDQSTEVLALHEALEKLEDEQPRVARVIELRYFVGLSLEETAEAMSVPVATVRREWYYGRAWLADRIRRGA